MSVMSLSSLTRKLKSHSVVGVVVAAGAVVNAVVCTTIFLTKGEFSS